MRKGYKVFIIIYFMVMAVVVFSSKDLTKYVTSLEYVTCGTASGIPKPLPQLTSIAYTILIVGTPLILIAASIITLFKAITGGNADEIMKAKNKLFKKFAVTAIIFLMASIVRFVIVRVSNNDKASVVKCMNCFLYNECTNSADESHGPEYKPGVNNPVAE